MKRFSKKEYIQNIKSRLEERSCFSRIMVCCSSQLRRSLWDGGNSPFLDNIKGLTEGNFEVYD